MIRHLLLSTDLNVIILDAIITIIYIFRNQVIINSIAYNRNVVTKVFMTGIGIQDNNHNSGWVHFVTQLIAMSTRCILQESRF